MRNLHKFLSLSYVNIVPSNFRIFKYTSMKRICCFQLTREIDHQVVEPVMGDFTSVKKSYPPLEICFVSNSKGAYMLTN